MKKLICAIILSGVAYGQGVRFESVATTTTAIGNYPNVQTVLPEATVKVYQYGTTVAATLCTDITCATPALTNIVTADAVGNFGFFAMPGNYSYQVSGTGAVTNMFSVTLGGGLIDPGSNGVLYRNGLNTTRDANYSDVVALWPACTGFLKFDGTCGTGGTGGGGDVTTTPTTSQEIIQPTGTNFCANILNGVIYLCPSWNWLRTPSGSLTGGAEATVTLDPAPLGIDTTQAGGYDGPSYGGYAVYISGTGTAEAAVVTGGTCTKKGTVSPCTVVFTPVNDHVAGFTVGSANGGYQEALNYAGTPNWHVEAPPSYGNPTGVYDNGPQNHVDVWWPIIIHQGKGTLSGKGATLGCHTLSRCLQVGTLANSNLVTGVTVEGFRFSPRMSDAGCAVTSTEQIAGVRTVTYTGSCSYAVGDWIEVDYTDDPRYWGEHQVSAASAGSISWVSRATGDIALQTTPGTISSLNTMVLDNGNGTTFRDLWYQVPTATCLSVPGDCAANNFFTIWDDEALTIDVFNSDGYGMMCVPTFCGSFLYSAGNVGKSPDGSMSYCTGGTCAPVISIQHFYVTGGGKGITVYNSNGLYVKDSIIQGTAMWNLYVSNILGNYQGAMLQNVYNESNGWTNTPYTPGFTGIAGIAGIIYGQSTGAASLKADSGNGRTPASGTGSTVFNYWIVPHDTTASPNTSTAPLLAQTVTQDQSGPITVHWPRIVSSVATNTITYDIIRTTGTLHTNGTAKAPMFGTGNCPGGSITACGSVAVGEAQCGGLVCSFTDDAGASTTNYNVTHPAAQMYPIMAYWPGDVVISTSNPVVDLFSSPTNVVSIQSFQSGPTLTSKYGYKLENTWIESIHDAGNLPFSQATILGDFFTNAAGSTNFKGRLNFYHKSIPAGGLAIQTLVDSNSNKTFATAGQRPVMDATDISLGLDNPTAVATNLAQFALGCGVSCSFYVSSLFDNASWLSRLNSTGQYFKTDVYALRELIAPNGCRGCGPFELNGTQVSDNFNRTDGSLGANWTDNGGTWTILNNQAKVADTTGVLTSDYNATFADDQYAQVDVVAPGASAVAGVRLRGTGTTDGYYCAAGSTGTTDLGITTGGINSHLSYSSTGFTAGMSLRCEAQGASLRLLQNGVVVQSATDTTYTSGTIGLWGMNSGSGPFDNFKAGDLNWSVAAKTIQVVGGSSGDKPSCSAAIRGEFYLTRGGAGVKDAVEVCAKDVSDAYDWRTVY